MKALRRFVSILALLACVAGNGDLAAAERPAKTGIVLVAFGTTVPEARAAYDAIERRVVASFPDTPVRWAYTSAAVRGKVARRGQALDSLETALARMMDEGFTHVAVQSLHVIAGWEFLEVQRNAAAFGGMAGGFARVTVGAPLLGAAADFPRVAAALLKMAADHAPGEAVVFMGHGTTHASNAGYAALMYHLQRRDPAVFMGTAGQGPGIEEIRDLRVNASLKEQHMSRSFSHSHALSAVVLGLTLAFGAAALLVIAGLYLVNRPNPVVPVPTDPLLNVTKT
jgi:sirohydrochlorin cobaltochelatase